MKLYLVYAILSIAGFGLFAYAAIVDAVYMMLFMLVVEIVILITMDRTFFREVSASVAIDEAKDKLLEAMRDVYFIGKSTGEDEALFGDEDDE